MNSLKNSCTFCLATCFLLSVFSSAHAQRVGLSATEKNIAYDSDDDSQKLDVYLADSASKKATASFSLAQSVEILMAAGWVRSFFLNFSS